MPSKAKIESQNLPIGQPDQIDRRSFISRSIAGVLALSLPLGGMNIAGKHMGIVVHSYASRWNSKDKSQQYPGFADAIQLLTHCHELGSSGIQVGVKGWNIDFARKLRKKKDQLGLYVEGSIGMPFRPEQVAVFEQEVAIAKEAGVSVIRTVCTAGRRYEIYHSRADFETARQEAITSLELVAPILRKHQIRLAVENHKDWRASELADMIRKMGSEWIGVTLDFGNSIALLEDPMEVVRTLAPYHFTTHVKDMAVAEYESGLMLSEVPLGTGILDLKTMVAICRKHNPAATFNLEMITRDPLQVPCLTDDYWQTFTSVPGSDLARTLRSVKTHPFTGGLPHVSQMTPEERLATEEQNIVHCLKFSADQLGMK